MQTNACVIGVCTLLYLSDADFSLYILQSLLKDRNESSRWNGGPVDTRLVYVALETEREGAVLKPTLQQVPVYEKVYLIACDTHPAKFYTLSAH